ncbi:hypothetical protein Vi05172_g9840 [Venturia inaequalis]|nr:hypothetical protein Vi05172_g9840 [Venturia inaequalis]
MKLIVLLLSCTAAVLAFPVANPTANPMANPDPAPILQTRSGPGRANPGGPRGGAPPRPDIGGAALPPLDPGLGG